MDERKFIYNNLDKLYEFKAANVRELCSVSCEGVIYNTVNRFLDESIKIFGEYEIDGFTSRDICLSWHEDRKEVMKNHILSFINNVDYSRGSVVIGKEIREKFVGCGQYDFGNNRMAINLNKNYLMREFYKVYIVKYLDPLIEEYLTLVKDEYITSGALFEGFTNEIIEEDKHLTKHIFRKINDWYYHNRLGDKVDEFLRQLVVTLTSTNWRVTWIGHGEFSETRIPEYFRGESSYQINKVASSYMDWYENEIIEASGRIMKIEV